MAWRQAVIWNTNDPIQWRIYAALGEDELAQRGQVTHMYMRRQTKSDNGFSPIWCQAIT